MLRTHRNYDQQHSERSCFWDSQFTMGDRFQSYWTIHLSSAEQTNVCRYIHVYIGMYEYIKPFQNIFQNPFCTVVTSAKYVYVKSDTTSTKPKLRDLPPSASPPKQRQWMTPWAQELMYEKEKNHCYDCSCWNPSIINMCMYIFKIIIIYLYILNVYLYIHMIRMYIVVYIIHYMEIYGIYGRSMIHPKFLAFTAAHLASEKGACPSCPCPILRRWLHLLLKIGKQLLFFGCFPCSAPLFGP